MILENLTINPDAGRPGERGLRPVGLDPSLLDSIDYLRDDEEPTGWRQQRALRVLVELLPEPERTVINGLFYQGLSLAAVSRQEDMHVQQVARARNDALSWLQGELEVLMNMTPEELWELAHEQLAELLEFAADENRWELDPNARTFDQLGQWLLSTAEQYGQTVHAEQV